MIIYTINKETYRVDLKGLVKDINILSEIQKSVVLEHKRQRMNYEPIILKETIKPPTANGDSCEMFIQCQDLDGLSAVVSILVNDFRSKKVISYEELNKNEKQSQSNNNLKYYDMKTSYSKESSQEESKTNYDNINNQNRPSNNSF